MRGFLLLFPLLGACGNLEGVWFLEFPYTEDGAECADNVKHNFKNADVIEDDAPIDTGSSPLDTYSTFEGDSTLAPAVIEITGDHGTLIFGGGVYPGAKDGGAWSFSWDEKTAGTDGRSFESDYSYDRQSDSVSKTTITVSLAGGDLDGTVKIESTSSMKFSETDEWSGAAIDAVGNNGSIPAGSYLETRDGERIRNAAGDADCDQETCSLTVSSTCSGTDTFTGFRTSFSVEEATDLAMKAQGGGGGGVPVAE